MLVEQPNRERHADLRVVGARAARHRLRRREQLVDPLLDYRFSVRTCDAHHGDVEAQTVLLCEGLEGLQRRSHQEKIGRRIVGLCVVGERADHKVAHTATIEVGDVAVAVARAGAQGKEQGGFGEYQRTTVGEQAFDVCVGGADAAGGNQIADVRDAIRHVQIVFAATRRAGTRGVSARRVVYALKSAAKIQLKWRKAPFRFEKFGLVPEFCAKCSVSVAFGVQRPMLMCAQ